MYERLPVPSALLTFIKEGSSFIIAGHEDPDGDCVCSALALSNLLETLGKKTLLVQNGPWKRSEILSFKVRFKDSLSAEEKDGARLIVVDCSSIDRCGKVKEYLQGMPTAFIDHHLTADGRDLDAPCYINPEAPATGSLILALFKAFETPVTQKAAEYLFFCLCTDTGFFRHVNEGGAVSLQDAKELIESGASPKKTFLAMHGGRSLSSRLLLAQVLSSTESFYGGGLLVATEPLSLEEKYGKESRDSDMLYQLLQSVDGSEACAVIREDTKENCAVGLRSQDRINVAQIAEKLGGGGHKNAAGAYKAGTILEVKRAVIELFAECFNGKKA